MPRDAVRAASAGSTVVGRAGSVGSDGAGIMADKFIAFEGE
jgi:hypothetical protein